MTDLLAEADVRIGGDRPWDLQVHDDHFHARVLAQGSLGLGESYMDGWWETGSLDGLLTRLLQAKLEQRKITQAKEEQSVDTLKKSMQVNEVSAAETARLRQKVQPINDKFAREVGEPLVQQVNAELARLRGAK